MPVALPLHSQSILARNNPTHAPHNPACNHSLHATAQFHPKDKIETTHTIVGLPWLPLAIPTTPA
eukprot:797157-Pelagomonas_calceolata.AAC.3